MTWQLAWGMLPLLFMLLGMLTTVGALHLVLSHERSKRRQSPLTRNMLRSPGHSVRQRINDLNSDLYAYFLATAMIPILALAGHLSVSYFHNEPETISRVLLTVLAAATMLFLAIRKVIRIIRELRSFVLGLEGELATGEELNQLMLDGCRVFHDIPFPYGNIDHVVVSPSGVYTVSTKMRGKPAEGDSELVVDHDRNLLRFPDGAYPIPTRQSETELKWLSDFLGSAIGQAVQVEAIIAYPGWFIKKRIGRGGVYVINPQKPHKFFLRSRSVLSPQMIQQVAHQLEQLVRDVEPSFRKDRKWETTKS